MSADVLIGTTIVAGLCNAVAAVTHARPAFPPELQ
jgi:hypothetical protein